MGVEKGGEEEGVPTSQNDTQQAEEAGRSGVEADWEEFGDALDEEDDEEEEKKDPEKARRMKEKGNRCFQAKDYEGAMECYSLAIRYCPYVLPPEPRARRRHVQKKEPEGGGGQEGGNSPQVEEGEGDQVQGQGVVEAEEEAVVEEPFAEYKEELAVYYGNRAACYVSMDQDKEAIDDCTAALRLKPNYIKASLRKAQACERLDRLEDALQEYKKVVEMDPSCRAAREKIPGLERECAQRMEKLKEETLGKLKELGNSILGGFGLSLDNFKMQQDPNSGSYSISFGK